MIRHFREISEARYIMKIKLFTRENNHGMIEKI